MLVCSNSLVLFWLFFFSLYLGRPILRFYNRKLSENTLVIGCWNWRGFELFLYSHLFYRWSHKGWVNLSDWLPGFTQDMCGCCCGRARFPDFQTRVLLIFYWQGMEEKANPSEYICGWEGHPKQEKWHGSESGTRVWGNDRPMMGLRPRH